MENKAAPAGGKESSSSKNPLTPRKIASGIKKVFNVPRRRLSNSGASGQRPLRRVKGAFSAKTTSVKPALEIETIVKALLDAHAESVSYTHKGFVFKIKSADSGVRSKVVFTLEVCRVADLELNGVYARRVSGDLWSYRRIVADLTKNLKI